MRCDVHKLDTNKRGRERKVGGAIFFVFRDDWSYRTFWWQNNEEKHRVRDVKKYKISLWWKYIFSKH